MILKYTFLFGIIAILTPGTLMKQNCGFSYSYNQTAVREYKESNRPGWCFPNLPLEDSWKINFECGSKCRLEKEGVFDKDGKYMSNGIRDYYKTCTNATEKYVEHIGEVYDGCKKDSDDYISELRKNGTAICECRFYALYENCVNWRRSKVKTC